MKEVKHFDYYGINVPYYEVVKKINGVIFRKYFIVDIRNLDRYKVIVDNFHDFQGEFFDKEYWYSGKEEFSYVNNMMLYFLCDKDKKYDIDKYSILNNFEYAFKEFITEDDLEGIMKNEGDFSLEDKEIIITGKNKDIVLNRFNLITGKNGSGKTTMLKEIADYCNSPIFEIGVNSFGIYFGKPTNGFVLDKYIKMSELTTCDMKFYDNGSFYDKYFYKPSLERYFYKLNKVMSCCSSYDVPLLLDELGFYYLDDRNQIKLIDALFEYSNNHDVVIADCKNQIKKLVKNRVYKSNIIEL